MKKKKSFIIFLMLLINSIILFAQNELEYTIIGTLPDTINNTYAYLSPLGSTETGQYPDSALILNGHFMFKGIANNKPALYQISTEYINMNGWVVVESGFINYNYQDEEPQGYIYTRGTPINDQLTDKIVISSRVLNQQMENFMKIQADTTIIDRTELNKQARLSAQDYYTNLISFLKENAKNSVGEYFFLSFSPAIKEKELNEILPNLTEEAKQKYYDKKNATIPQPVTEGRQYIPFKGKTIINEPFILSNIIHSHKLILLDFWASWCVPCLKSMPEIAEIYDNYKNEGLEIVGISLDENETLWKKAVEKNNMSWIQIISNIGENDNIAKMYGVNLIPYTLLVNSEGEIVSVNLRGKELREKIKKNLE
jgi:thiol-disulfide isomerase/thioredoxin